MTIARNIGRLAVMSVVAGCLAESVKGQAQRYYVIDLGTPGVTLGAHARAINNAGDIVGVAGTEWGGEQAVVWTGPDHAMTVRADLIHANDINDAGLIVGVAFFPSHGFHAFSMAGADGEATWLHASFEGSWVYSTAFAVNAGGLVVGSISNAGPTHVSVWSGVLGEDLSGDGGTEGQATCVNSGGLIAGTLFLGGVRHAFIGSGPFLDLGTLNGPGIEEGWHSEACGINDAGVVVGRAFLPGGYSRAFRWTSGVGMEDLSPDELVCWASSVNEDGLIVGGRYDFSTATYRAMGWVDGVMFDLNDRTPPGSALVYDARDVNDAGWIVGYGRGAGQWYDHPYLLIPAECSADFDGTGFVDTDDYDAFMMAFESGDPKADFDGTGFVDTDDFDAFATAFEAGC